MATPNRAQILNAALKVLKKHYQPVEPIDRSVLENLIYGLCLENARYEQADEVFAALKETFFDWNEVRVTTVTELSETCRPLPDPSTAASNIRRALHAIFESQFSFDLEPLKKENLGKAVKQLEKHEGVTPFAVGYVVQHALGGHAIPVDNGLIQTMLVLGVITSAEADKKTVPGLDRSIPKSKGIEFASLIHQLSADYLAAPRSPRIRPVLLEIAPDAKDRLPKRGTKKKAEPPEKPAAAEKAVKKKTPSAPPKKAAAKPAGKKSAKPTGDATPAKKKPAAKPTKKKKPAAKKKSTSRRLARQKPR